MVADSRMSTADEGTPMRERPVADLLRELADNTTSLVHQEIDLAKAEIMQKGKEAGIGLGMLGASGAFGFLALGSLTTGLIGSLSRRMSLRTAALVTGAVYGAAAAALAVGGKDRLLTSTRAVANETIDSVKEDVDWAKTRATSARQ